MLQLLNSGLILFCKNRFILGRFFFFTPLSFSYLYHELAFNKALFDAYLLPNKHTIQYINYQLHSASESSDPINNNNHIPLYYISMEWYDDYPINVPLKPVQQLALNLLWPLVIPHRES